ncbi:SMI1/KNR4 family protein [Micromonospora sp. NPDC007271]|uniref:SMI1/KNR4 family protein n=1 Tax=Micromonospora sp. NPDC007271 TaxID=3154587 RepID=UPI0033DC1291
MTLSDWSDVPGRLASLSTHPNADTVFGANRHQWRSEPPLTMDELAELESQLGVELPAEYRSFLLQVSRGGTGPAYGLFPVQRVDGRWRWEGDGADLTDLDTLSRPFPHTDAFNPADALPDPPTEEDFDSEAEFNEAEDAYWQQHEAVVFSPGHSIGLLYLCHLGCAYRNALVISGPARGQMWADDTAGDGGFRPLHESDGSPTGFTRWYRGWLEQAEEQTQRGASRNTP